MENIDHPLLHWIPYKLIEKNNDVYFEWIYLGDRKYTDPFFEETISKCKSHPYNSKAVRVVSTIENLLDWSKQLISVQLKSLVFHVSRCGSTMLSQSLVTSSGNIMISEAPLIDQILRTTVFDFKQKCVLVEAVIRLLGQKRFPEQKNLIIKLDAWHIFNVAQFRLIFPELPFMLLYREPTEILKSHQKMTGMHMVPGLIPHSVFGITCKVITEISHKQYGALVLEKYFQAFLDFYATDHNVLMCNYNDGMQSVIERFISFVVIYYSTDEVNEMFERLKKHSKNENAVFNGDFFTDEVLAIDFTQLKILYEKLSNIQITV
ncbi:sulfotransferase family protein [Flavobacterium sp. GNP002]